MTRPISAGSGYLLDTNVLLIATKTPDRLGKSSQHILSNNQNLHFSSLSIVEVEIKVGKGKLPPMPNFANRLEEFFFKELPLESKHAAELNRFPELWDHDPFDRILLAQATREKLKFLTTDQRLLRLGFDWIVDAYV